MLATSKLAGLGAGRPLDAGAGSATAGFGRAGGCCLTQLGSALGWFMLILCLPGVAGFGEEAPADRLRQQTEKIYTAAREEFHLKPGEAGAALAFAAAAFDWAELDETNRAAIAGEGIDASRAALRIDPRLGEASYYLAVNLGQLARTRKLGALKLLGEMEKEFLKAIERSPRVHYGGPHRSLGMMYEQAPGWPLSLGSSRKARVHLEKAVELVPGFPGNHLVLMEAYLVWGKEGLARGRLAAAKGAMEAARMTLKGLKWEATWVEWEERLKRVEEAVK